MEEIDQPIRGFNEYVVNTVISNGSFCLSADKKSLLALAYKYLRHEGKMVVCTTVTKERLESGVKNPPGIDKIIHIDDIEPMLEEIGFTNVVIDQSATEMRFEVEVDGKKQTVQVGPESFSDPQYGFDKKVNDMIARVTIIAEKPPPGFKK